VDKLTFQQFFASQLDRLAAAGYANREDFSGISTDEIDSVEAAQGVSLPSAYVSFLQVMGRAAGPLFLGSDVTFPDVLWFRTEAARIAADVEADITALGVVFLIHQGYDMLLLGSGTDDPPVYRLTDSMPQPEQASDSFTEFFESEVDRLLASRRFDNRRSSALTMDEVRELIARRDAGRRQS
jgi:hypothetical protein